MYPAQSATCRIPNFVGSFMLVLLFVLSLETAYNCIRIHFEVNSFVYCCLHCMKKLAPVSVMDMPEQICAALTAKHSNTVIHV